MPQSRRVGFGAKFATAYYGCGEYVLSDGRWIFKRCLWREEIIALELAEFMSSLSCALCFSKNVVDAGGI